MTAADGQALLHVDGLGVAYQRSIIGVQDVSLRVPAHGIVALLGSNGAGKTTTLRAISGFLGLDNARVVAGSVTFKGRRIENLSPHQTARRGIAIVPEREKIFPNLSVADNLTVVAPAGVRGAERNGLTELVYHYFPRLAEHRRRAAGLLSGGERQMLAIGSALVCKPDLLMIDELSLGLAPIVVDELCGRLLEVCRELGLAVLVVEQSAAVALRFADHGYVLENGQVAFSGSSRELSRDVRVQESYLGASGGGRRKYGDVVEERLARGNSHA
ncbi:MAG TPA: ABC transporter ATP-binding protein [Gammaproteobacteria bacterium]|nr:ABC transporter ATP-binding protein [Gammaproteobacteria bacterium]